MVVCTQIQNQLVEIVEQERKGDRQRQSKAEGGELYRASVSSWLSYQERRDVGPEQVCSRLGEVVWATTAQYERFPLCTKANFV